MKESLLAFCLLIGYYISDTTYYEITFFHRLFITYICMMPYFVFVCNEDIDQKYSIIKNRVRNLNKRL